ncbi:MAG: tetratricopeptide repeat protein [Desulfarculus sp.]|nr:tetratricopeptide repeat protein [Desulfarculus sp.]
MRATQEPQERPIAKPRTYRLLMLLALAVLCWPRPALATQITAWQVARDGQATRLIFSADSPLDYQVELSDPQTVVLRLRGVTQAPVMPAELHKDPLVRFVEVQPTSKGIDLVIRTSGPGLTVLPFYEAANRRLTLELGGPPSLQVAVPAPAPKTAEPAQAAPAPKEPAPAPAPPAAPAPAGPKTKAAMPADAEPPELVLPRTPGARPQPGGPAARVTVPLGDAPPAPAPAPVQPSAPLFKPGTTSRPLADAPAASPAGPQAVARGAITPEAAAPPEAKAPAPAPAAQVRSPMPPPEPAAPAPKPPAPKAAAPVAPVQPPAPAPAPAAPPAAPPAAQPTPATPPPPAAAKGPAPQVQRVRLGSHPGFSRLVLEADAPLSAILEDQGQQVLLRLARGQLAPKVELPRADARVREMALVSKEPLGLGLTLGRHLSSHKLFYLEGGKKLVLDLTLAPPGSPPPAQAPRPPLAAAPAAPQPAQPPAPAPAKVAQPMPPSEGQALVKGQPGPAGGPPATITQRPPQAAKLGPEGQADAQARAFFALAKEALDNRRFTEAGSLFQRFLATYPQHELAADATYRLADALFYLRERQIIPHYAQVMEYYQRALDLYPDSPLAPWALYMMGKASQLFEQPFKALGYFDLAIKDYPQSEILPLALVSRGQAQLADQNYNQALNDFKDVATRFPTHAARKEADWGQAQALFGLGAWGRAGEALKEMHKRHPDLHQQEPELLYYIGESLFQQRDYPQARSYYLWAYNLKPEIRDNDIILARVGDTYKFEGEFKTAQEVYKQVVSLFPDSDGALVSRIRLAETPAKDEKNPWDIFQVQATSEAKETYEEIAQSHANRPVGELARLKLGVYYYKTGDFAKSLDILENLLQDHPRGTFKVEMNYTLNLAALGLMQQFKEQGRPMDLMSAFLRYRPFITRPGANEVLLMLCWAYERTGLTDRAARTYRVLIGRGLKDPALKVGLAKSLMAERDYPGVAEALGGLNTAGLTPAERLESMSLLGRALSRLGYHQPAEQVLGLLLKSDTQNTAAKAADHQALGHSLAQMGQLGRALEAFDQADKLYAQEPAPQAQPRRYLLAMEAGLTARQAGLHEASLAYLEQAKKLAPGDGERGQALYELAQGHGQAGQQERLEAAMGELAKLKISPWSAMAERHLADLAMAARLAQAMR